MTRLLSALMLVLVGTSFHHAFPTPARACTPDPDFDKVRDSELIVEGRFTGWDYAPEVTFPAEDGVDSNLPVPYVPIYADFAVEKVHKGSAPRTLMVYDPVSLDVYDHEPRHVWIGASGACGAFTSDPTDVYAIITLSKISNGVYRSSIFGWLYAGEGPAGEAYEDALRTLSEAGLQGALPGDEQVPQEAEPEDEATKETPWLVLLPLAFAIPLAVLVVPAFFGKRGGGGH